jgi:hypothetical protein
LARGRARTPVTGRAEARAMTHPLHRLAKGLRQWSWAAGSGVPAVTGSGAADQPAAHDRGTGQPERHHQPAPFGAPAPLAVLVGPRMGALHQPATASLDRRGLPRVAISAAMPARLAPAGTAASRSRRPGARWAAGAAGRAARGRPGSRPAARRRGGWPGHRGQRNPTRLDRDRAFQPLLARIHRAGPGDLAAAGGLVMQPSTARCSSSRPNSRS